jgi:hypothetical protein
MESCSYNFVLSDMVFDRCISAMVANTFKQAVRGALQSNVKDLICQQMSEVQTEVTCMSCKVYKEIETFLSSSRRFQSIAKIN